MILVAVMVVTAPVDVLAVRRMGRGVGVGVGVGVDWSSGSSRPWSEGRAARMGQFLRAGRGVCEDALRGCVDRGGGGVGGWGGGGEGLG